jgi:hypothetical protein
MSGLLVHGALVPVDGVDIITSADAPWCKAPSSRVRLVWPRQLILHKTIADDPERIILGSGPPDGDKATIEAWAGGVDGAHLVVGFDGRVCCLADLATAVTFHATASNPWSVGLEMKEQPGGGVYAATLHAAVEVTIAACRALGIQLQMPKLGSYTGHPIPRMSDTGASPGGPDMVGIFGHRDNTERRGRWDPGDMIWEMFAERGVDQFDFATGEDLAVWKQRQQTLNDHFGAGLVVDGVPGPGTVAALKAAGYRDGIWALGVG